MKPQGKDWAKEVVVLGFWGLYNALKTQSSHSTRVWRLKFRVTTGTASTRASLLGGQLAHPFPSVCTVISLCSWAPVLIVSRERSGLMRLNPSSLILTQSPLYGPPSLNSYILSYWDWSSSYEFGVIVQA